MIVTNKTCSRRFRELLFSEYPVLSKNKMYAKFLEYLILGTYRCEYSGRLIISKEILSQIEEVSSTVVKNRNYAGNEFLETFSNTVLPITVYDYVYTEGKARTVEVNFPPHIQSIIIAEYQGRWKDTGKVYFVSGETYTKETSRKERRRMKAYTETLMAHNGRTQELLEYLNNLPANRFTKLLNNIGDAYRAAAYIENPRTRDTQISLLRSIEDQSQPFYKPLERTSRVVSLNESLLYLKRDVRKALCKGWYEVDLKSAQLAIISTIWDIPSVRTMLTQTTGVWDYFADYFQVYGNTKEIKDAVKRPLYAVVYGMSKDNTRKFADRMLADAGLKNGGELFLVSELVQTLFAYREDMVKRVLSDKGVKDAFGNWISLQGRTARSLLAQQAQSYELQLLWPIVEQARQTNDFVITAFQHDGLSLDITRRADSWLERLRVMVQNQAEIYNIPTALEVEVL